MNVTLTYYCDDIMKNPLFYSSTPKHTECLHKKRQMLEQIESKLDTGLDR